MQKELDPCRSGYAFFFGADPDPSSDPDQAWGFLIFFNKIRSYFLGFSICNLKKKKNLRNFVSKKYFVKLKISNREKLC